MDPHDENHKRKTLFMCETSLIDTIRVNVALFAVKVGLNHFAFSLSSLLEFSDEIHERANMFL